MDETKPLIVSQAVAGALGAGWLLLVFLTPPPPPTISLLRPEEAAAVEVEFEDEKPKPAPEPKPDEPPPPDPSEEASKKAEAKARRESQAAADAFGGGAPTPAGDVTNALRGVEVSRGGASGGSGGIGAGGGIGGGKAVIGYGAAGTARTPGKGIDPSVAAAGEGIGTVNASGNVSRANIAVAAPTIVRSADGGASGRDMTRLGTFVRARNAQLQYCYRDVGVPLNDRLAGSINVAVTMDAGGTVTDARVATRTWSGAGVAEAEACVLQRVKGWAFPASSKAGSETYNFSFIFNR